MGAPPAATRNARPPLRTAIQQLGRFAQLSRHCPRPGFPASAFEGAPLPLPPFGPSSTQSLLLPPYLISPTESCCKPVSTGIDGLLGSLAWHLGHRTQAHFAAFLLPPFRSPATFPTVIRETGRARVRTPNTGRNADKTATALTCQLQQVVGQSSARQSTRPALILEATSFSSVHPSSPLPGPCAVLCIACRTVPTYNRVPCSTGRTTAHPTVHSAQEWIAGPSQNSHRHPHPHPILSLHPPLSERDGYLLVVVSIAAAASKYTSGAWLREKLPTSSLGTRHLGYFST